MNRIGTDKQTNFSMPFYNKRKVEQNGIEEIIEINLGEEQNCVVEVLDCKKSLISLGYKEANDDSVDRIAENIKGTIGKQQIKDYSENVSVDEDREKHNISDFLQKDRFSDSTEEFIGNDGSIEEVINGELSITKEDGNVKNDNKLDANLLFERPLETRNIYNTLRVEKNYSNKMNAIDILSKLKDISNKLK